MSALNSYSHSSYDVNQLQYLSGVLEVNHETCQTRDPRLIYAYICEKMPQSPSKEDIFRYLAVKIDFLRSEEGQQLLSIDGPQLVNIVYGLPDSLLIATKIKNLLDTKQLCLLYCAAEVIRKDFLRSLSTLDNWPFIVWRDIRIECLRSIFIVQFGQCSKPYWQDVKTKIIPERLSIKYLQDAFGHISDVLAFILTGKDMRLPGDPSDQSSTSPWRAFVSSDFAFNDITYSQTDTSPYQQCLLEMFASSPVYL